MRNVRVLLAEAIGTFLLLFGGVGTAVFAADAGSGVVALGFGLALLVAVYAVGPVSGAHLNPAVTLGMTLMRRTPVSRVPAYLAGQLIGGILGAGAVLVIAEGGPGAFDAEPLTFAANLWGSFDTAVGPVEFFGLGAVALTEILLTGLLVFAYLAVTDDDEAPDYAGVVLGGAYVLIHLVALPVDNASVNPVRSLATAVYAGGDSLEQLWAFVVFPLVGAVVGFLAWLAVDDSRLEDTLLGDVEPLVAARDQATRVADTVEDAID